jgi:hypothetical protein
MTEKSNQTNVEQRKSYRLFLRILFCLLTIPLTGWVCLAVYYSNLPGSLVRTVCSILSAVVLLSLFFWVRSLKAGIITYAIVFGVVLGWWWLIPASNDRDWHQDVATLPSAEITGNIITIHNIRNFDYSSTTDYAIAHYDKTVNLDQLETVDLFLVYWGPRLIAHTIMSFGFADGTYIAISIETRKEKGEEYSAIKGFFKQYELTYVVADERDVVRLRSNYRNEDVYLYRLQVDKELARAVFIDYFNFINRLAEEPAWYNALTMNCTTAIRGHSKPYSPDSAFDWRRLANGRIDEMMYERGTITSDLSFDEHRKQSLINEHAQTHDQDPGFSQRIREAVLPEHSQSSSD